MNDELDPLPPAPAPPPPPPPPPRGPRRVVLVGTAIAVVVAVVASVVLASRSGTGGPGGPNPAASPSPSGSAASALSAPAALTSEASPFEVTISWTAPTGTVAVEAYHVYRNDTLLGFVEPPETSYTDRRVVPGRAYIYEVLARGGGVESDRTSVDVKLRRPPIGDARVQGTYNVKVRATSHSGYSRFTETFTTGWTFTPKCKAGACRVTWEDLAAKGFKTTLKRSKASYSGSDSGNFNVLCGEEETVTVLDVSFKVDRAKAGIGSWKATRLVGTLIQTEDAQLGCVSSTATYSITASLIG